MKSDSPSWPRNRPRSTASRAGKVVHRGGHKNRPDLFGILVFRPVSRIPRSGEGSPTLSAAVRFAACFRGVSPCLKRTKVPAAGELDVTIGQDPEAHGFLTSAFIEEQISGQVVELA